MKNEVVEDSFNEVETNMDEESNIVEDLMDSAQPNLKELEFVEDSYYGIETNMEGESDIVEDSLDSAQPNIEKELDIVKDSFDDDETYVKELKVVENSFNEDETQLEKELGNNMAKDKEVVVADFDINKLPNVTATTIRKEDKDGQCENDAYTNFDLNKFPCENEEAGPEKKEVVMHMLKIYLDKFY
ncbi:hypothetical protein RJT34_32814 [Clitoria ternatea]|uniref:Uncharacterized protein n=1 Tax=Clitoria ternatea TaxID=43366 RepID=A0AAN9EZ71_CLITE